MDDVHICFANGHEIKKMMYRFVLVIKTTLLTFIIILQGYLLLTSLCDEETK
jgi:hypothetical protein